MRVFVTGATGWIGSAVVPELLGAGHEVVGLARSDESAAALEAAGAGVHRGSLEDVGGLRSVAAASDGVIHAAFKHDAAFSGDWEGASDADLRAVEALGEALEGSGKPLVVTSGTSLISPGGLGTEEDPPEVGTRVAAENAAVALAGRGVRSSVVRPAPSVHGEGDRGFIPILIGVAREKGVSAYVGDGANRWPAVHRLDAARLYRLALERAPAGTRLHAVAEEGVPVRRIAEAIGRALDVPVVSIPQEEAGEHFGFLAGLLGSDTPASSALTRELVGWEPAHPGLVDDLERGHYFQEARV